MFCAFFHYFPDACLRFVCAFCAGCNMYVLCVSKMFVLNLQSIDFQLVTNNKGVGGVNSTKLLCGANVYF